MTLPRPDNATAMPPLPCHLSRTVAHAATANGNAARRQQQDGRAPVRGLDGQPQGRLTEHAACHAHRHGEAREDRKPIGWEPVPGDGHGSHQAECGRGADQEAAGDDGGEGAAGRKQDAAAGADQGGDRHQPAGSETVEQEADGDLHARVAVEVGGRQMAEHARTHGEIAHQFFHHDAGRHAQHPRVEEERCARRPGKQRENAQLAAARR